MRCRSHIRPGAVTICDRSVMVVSKRNVDSGALRDPVVCSNAAEQPSSSPHARKGRCFVRNGTGRCGNRKIGFGGITTFREGATPGYAKQTHRDDKAERIASVRWAAHTPSRVRGERQSTEPRPICNSSKPAPACGESTRHGSAGPREHGGDPRNLVAMVREVGAPSPAHPRRRVWPTSIQTLALGGQQTEGLLLLRGPNCIGGGHRRHVDY
jgi:hypothetical protein